MVFHFQSPFVRDLQPRLITKGCLLKMATLIGFAMRWGPLLWDSHWVQKAHKQLLLQEGEQAVLDKYADAKDDAYHHQAQARCIQFLQHVFQ